MKTITSKYLSFLPIPALVVIITAFYLIIKPSLFFEPAWLLPITNTVFVTVVFFIVAYIAMRNYKATGRIQILLLGCGVLAFGIGGVVAGLVRSIPGAGANLNVTIYNTGALIGAIFHFVAALILLMGISPEVGAERKGFWLLFGYVGLTIFAALFTMASLKGIIPPFFIQGVGPTTLRQAVLGIADILFAFSFLIFMGTYLRNGEAFLYWYSSALALTSISLTAFFIQSAVGSPIGWAGRFSQYLGGVYFLIAILTAIRSAQVRRTSFDDVLTASLSPAEEKFRALAEHSPDMIERVDREIRYLYVNRAGLQFFGKPAADLIGRTIEEAGLPESYCNLWKERIQRVFETGQPMEVEDYLPSKNSVGFYQSHCIPEYGVDGTVANVLVVSRDLTARKRAEEGIGRQNMVLEGINRIFQETLSSRTDEELGQTCLVVAEELTKSKFGFIGETGSDGFLHDVAISDPGWELCTMYDKTGHRRPLGNFKVHGLYGRVLQDGKSLLANTPAEHPDSIGTPAGHPLLRAFLGTPLIRGGRTIGMIAVANRDGGYSQNEQDALEALAPAVVEAFLRKRAEQAFREAHERAVWLARFPGENPNPVARVSAEGNVLYRNLPAAELPGWACEVGKPLPDVLLALVEQTMTKGQDAQQDAELGGRFYSVAISPFPAERYANIYGRDITERKRAEEALRQRTLELQELTETLDRRVQERTTELAKANETLRDLSSRLLSAHEEERKKIAGEIHDTLGSCLSGIKFKVENILQQVRKGANAETESLSTVIPIIQEGIEECRRMQMDLRPAILDDLGLLPTLSWFCRRFQTIYSSIRIEREIGIEEDEIPNAFKIVVYRVTQEAMNNIAKHSEANLVRLSLRKRDKKLEFVIQDNGQGFNMEKAGLRESTMRGLGLSSMRERVELSGGLFTIESRKGAGTLIRASWPL